MSLRTILHHPDPRLRRVAQPVVTFGAQLRQLADDMLETMYHHQGIGLAATQIGELQRLVVIDASESRNQPLILVNPKITVLDPATSSHEEGCLSVPDVYNQVERASHIRLTWQDLDGAEHSQQPEGLLAVCAQHECDHLDGRLFIDYLSSIRRARITHKLGKARAPAR